MHEDLTRNKLKVESVYVTSSGSCRSAKLDISVAYCYRKKNNKILNWNGMKCLMESRFPVFSIVISGEKDILSGFYLFLIESEAHQKTKSVALLIFPKREATENKIFGEPIFCISFLRWIMKLSASIVITSQFYDTWCTNIFVGF